MCAVVVGNVYLYGQNKVTHRQICHVRQDCEGHHSCLYILTEKRHYARQKVAYSFRWFLISQILQCCSPDILKRFVTNFMPVSEIDSPLLTIVVNRPFRIRCLSHTSSTSSYNTGVLAVLRSSRKNTFFYWWSLSVRADSMPRLGTDACHRAIGMIQTGTPQCDIALRFGVHRNTISSLWSWI